MYIPKAFEVSDKNELEAFIKNNSFGIIFSQRGNHPLATHLPFLIDLKRNKLISHMAKANDHWKEITTEVLVVFQGPHAYISPSWYDEKNTVPTWNYVAVHVTGDFKIVNDTARIKEIIVETVQFFEARKSTPWTVNINNDFIENLLNGIVVFEIDIKGMEGKWKLNQNHSIERQNRVIQALRQMSDQNEQEIASLMQKNLELFFLEN